MTADDRSFDDATRLARALGQRFGTPAPACDPALAGLATLRGIAERRSIRDYDTHRTVDRGLLRLLCAVALSAPTKSDLQQRDIIILEDATRRRRVTSLLGETWIDTAPAFLVFCGNNRRQRQIHDWRGRPFPNDHLDAFFNAAVDAGIALATFVTAAEAAGLGCCPISQIRNHCTAVSQILELPPHVFPVAGMTLGWPTRAGQISLRLPLEVTLHTDRFDESDLAQRIDAYDRRRSALQPYARQRYEKEFGHAEPYGWSEDKARQYSKPERADFGAFVRAKGFDLR